MRSKVPFNGFILFLIFGATMISSHYTSAQDCSESDLFQKYWQYKKRFDRHFIVQDRDPSGCVNDGIGFSTGIPNSDPTCEFTKHGFGLPATNLMISPNGAGLQGSDLNQRFDDINNNPPIGDRDCSGPISWNGESDPNTKHNWIDFGSETLIQLGWHFVTLATQFELLGRSGQTQEQQKVLEEIFLGIQAIRRLDMQTQCMLKEMYDERKVGEGLVCAPPYAGAGTNHKHFDAIVSEDCNFIPDFSGFNGFFIRGDAAQNLEEYLHDPTDDSWNVDAVGGAFSGIDSDNEACDDIDPFCWMVFTQHFMSQDQLIGLFYGFSFIKKYIPPTATVTTCDGQTFHPLQMVQQMSEAIVNRINDNGDHITLPGSEDCCNHQVKISESEGGNLRWTMYGFLKTNEVLLDKKVKTTLPQRVYFESGLGGGIVEHSGLMQAHILNGTRSKFLDDNEILLIPEYSSNFAFYVKQSSMFKDFSFLSNTNKEAVAVAANYLNKEILLLGNDLLFPDGESVSELVGGEAFFRSLLCAAPCEGPCHFNRGGTDYNYPVPDPNDGWPNDFHCANVKGWEGNRWDGIGDDVTTGSITPPKKTNGLDYMALFNMYMLKYGSGDFYNPENPQASFTLQLRDDIEGPMVLCADEIGEYTIKGISSNDILGPIQWTSSSNLTLGATDQIRTTAGFNTLGSGNIGKLNVVFQKNELLPQFFTVRSNNQLVDRFIADPPEFVEDKCAKGYEKAITKAVMPNFEIKLELDACARTFIAWAYPLDGSGIERHTFTWTIRHNNNVVFESGQSVDIVSGFPGGLGGNYAGGYDIQVVINNGCGGTQTLTTTAFIEACGDGDIGFQMLVTPNPSHGNVRVNVYQLQNGISTPAQLDPVNGYPVYVRHVNGGPSLLSTRIYQNNADIDTSFLPNGYYDLILDMGARQLSRNIILQR